MKDDGGPAFPCPPELQAVGGDGMRTRDYFAAHAPPPPEFWWYLNDEKGLPFGERFEIIRERLTEYAYEYADSMLEARKK